MNSQLNKIKFKKIALSDRQAVDKYIHQLQEKKLPVILSGDHFAFTLGFNAGYVYAASNSKEEFYRNFKVRKKSGGFRNLSAPLPYLLYMQRWILKHILEKSNVHPAAKAYIKGKSIKDNVKFHRKQNIVFKSDVVNFFGSISDYWVYNYFCSLGYTRAVSRLFSELCCKNNSLPQGAATSGYLSNLYMREFDNDVFVFCRDNNLRYTRYADDITISGNSMNFEEISNFIEKSLENIHLKMNHYKTRFLRSHQRQKITGVVVNQRLTPGRNFLRQLRQDIHFVKRFGIHGHAFNCGAESPLACLNNILGRLSYAIFLLGENNSLEADKSYLEAVLSELD